MKVPDYCVLCMEAEADPEREDGFCEECGKVSDEYSFNDDYFVYEKSEDETESYD